MATTIDINNSIMWRRIDDPILELGLENWNYGFYIGTYSDHVYILGLDGLTETIFVIPANLVKMRKATSLENSTYLW